jgi:hypothetical protein
MHDFAPPPPDTRTLEEVLAHFDELIRWMNNSGIKPLTESTE